MRRCSTLCLAIAALTLLLVCGQVLADPVAPGGTVSIKLNSDTDDDTGIILKNLTGNTGEVTIEYIAGDPLGGGGGGGGGRTVQSPFILLDGTLRVTTTGIGPGDYRLLVKREYDRARARARSLKEETMRPLLARPLRPCFRPAVERIYRQRNASIRYRYPASAPTRGEIERNRTNGGYRALGLHGHDVANSYVWAVVDLDGDFAAGGLVPEPLTLTALGGGFALVAGSAALRRRRRKE